ncbi:FHA domain-containing protein [Pseudarthrobacter sp. NS4]|uniref:FHA domain-containing protein n=1 Tax=Pseudarthrobacter sp. NS4 TaxID=2973976 RepID=UPI0037C82FCD
MSRVHAALAVHPDGRVSVQDLGSSSGTAVNGRLASGRVLLRSGDVVSFGGARFQYRKRGSHGCPARSGGTASTAARSAHTGSIRGREPARGKASLVVSSRHYRGTSRT